MAILVITRHKALVEFLVEEGILQDGDYIVVPHASEEDVRGKIVVGVLPLHLAALAKEVIAPIFELKPEDRGRELSIEELRERFRGIERYRVFKSDQIEEARRELAQALSALREEGWNGWGFNAPVLDEILG